MGMGFGFGAGDLFVLSERAWAVWQLYRDAPKSFQNISQELLSMHALTKDAKELLEDTEISPSQQESLKIVSDGCFAVLEDLEVYMGKFESLGTQSKRTFERLQWDKSRVKELRLRLVSNITMLDAEIR
jgi:hypothetical protein